MKKITCILCALFLGVSFATAADGDKPKPDLAAIFAKKDKDGDGKLSKEEFLDKAKDPAKAEKAFARKDKDGDGFLSKEEFVAQPKKN